MEFENIPKDTEEINEFLLPFILNGISKTISKVNKYTLILLGLLAGVAIYIIQKLFRMLIAYIKQARFESKAKDIFISHFDLMQEFINTSEKLGIEKSGFVTLDNINSDTLKCIKNENHVEALTCTITIFKESHFYLMDLFLQLIYFNDIKLNDIKRVSQLRAYDTGNENINSYISAYYGLIKNYFKLIIDLKKINKEIVLNPYMIEQEFNQKFVELVSYYEELIKKV